MPKNGIPNRWLDYSNYGKPIPGTKFIAFKVPLNQNLNHRLPEAERWTPVMLLKEIPDLGMVIDLTNTSRYYNPQILKKNNLVFVKIQCEGHGKLPTPRMLERFFDAVDSFMNAKDNCGPLLGVHCTHGLNRTGYFICRYMIDKMGFAPEDAISAFNEARGHPMERLEYINALKSNNRIHPQPLSPHDSYAVASSGNNGVGMGNYSTPNYQQFQQLRQQQSHRSRLAPSFFETTSQGHSMASIHTRSQYLPSGSRSGPSEAAGSRILYQNNAMQSNVQHQELFYPSSLKENSSATFQNYAHDYERTSSSRDLRFTHQDRHGAEGRDFQSYQVDTQLAHTNDGPVYPNQTGSETKTSQPYMCTEFDRTLYPSQENHAQSQDLNSYSMRPQLDGSPFPNEHQKSRAVTHDPNGYSERTQMDKPLFPNQNSETGTETRDYSSHNDWSYNNTPIVTGYGESWHSHEGYNNARTNGNGYDANSRNGTSNFCLYEDGDRKDYRDQWSRSYEEPVQEKRGSSGYYRKPYRPFKRRH